MLRCMRTTLSLDDDVAAEIRRLRKARRAGLKELVNEALRLGLAKMQEEPARRAFRLETISAGKALVADVDCISRVLDELEGPRRA